MFNLTLCLEKIMNDGECVDKPIIQVLALKKIASNQTPDRYRLLLSDGVHTVSSAMLATQLNEKIHDKQIDTHSIIRLDKYICNIIQGDKKVLVVMDATVIAIPSIAGGKIGDPQPYKAFDNSTNNNINVNSGNANFNNSNNPNNANSNKPNNSNNNSSGFGSTISNPQVAAAKSFGNNKISKPSNQGQSSYGGTQGFSSVGSQLNSGTPSKIHAIASLNPYNSNWTIKARVTQKTGIKTWSNAKGEGQLFNINLLDESGEIRATAFKNEVTKFYNMIEVNKVYIIRNANVKPTNKQYCDFNDFEMQFNGGTEVTPCHEDNNIPLINFKFVSFNDLQDMQPNSTIDVIGVVKEFGDMKVVRKADGKELKKRDLTLVDQSLVQIQMTLWGDEAENFDGSGFPIIALKGCRLSDWKGRSLSQTGNSQLILNPDHPQGHSLRGWFDHSGHSASFMEFKSDGQGANGGNENWKTFGEIKAQNLASDKADYFTTKATISTIKKDNCLYMGCPECNKKVLDNGNGLYRCEKCAKEYSNFQWRLILQMNLSDFTDNIWVTCFQDTAEIILGRNANEVGQLKEMNPTAFDQVFNDANFSSFIFKMKSKMETYNDESRLKTICAKIFPINHAEYGAKLLAEIENSLGPI